MAPAAPSWVPASLSPRHLAPSSPSALRRSPGPSAAVWYSRPPRAKMPWTRSLARCFPSRAVTGLPKALIAQTPWEIQGSACPSLPAALRHHRVPLLWPRRTPRGSWKLARLARGRGGNPTHLKFRKVSKDWRRRAGGTDQESGDRSPANGGRES